MLCYQDEQHTFPGSTNTQRTQNTQRKQTCIHSRTQQRLIFDYADSRGVRPCFYTVKVLTSPILYVVNHINTFY